MGTSAKAGPLYWIVSVLLMIWALGGLSIYVALFIEGTQQFAGSAEDAAYARAYQDYIERIPAWSLAAAVVAALTRFIGALGLLARRAWAQPFFLISLLLFLATLFRAFVLDTAASAMSPRHIGIEIVFVALGVFAIWFAARMRSKGILR